MRLALLGMSLMLLATATPAIGSFHDTPAKVYDREFLLVMQGTGFNGLHAPDAPILEAYAGEHVRFTVLAAEAHTFHLHGHPWLLTTGRVVDTFLVNADTPHIFDVTAGGPDHNPGDWMYHCHVDAHMRGGMWGVFRVYPFTTDIQRIGNTIDVTLDRLDENVDGAMLAIAVDGVDIPAHVEPLGHGEYRIHAPLPPSGVLVVTATHPTLGVSVARAGLGGTSVPALTVDHAHVA